MEKAVLSLFMVMLGGRHARANTEVHDVVFAIGNQLEDCYPQLREAWFGEQKGLHIDAWMKVSGVMSEGIPYQLQLTNAAPHATSLKLWLINLGGYDSAEFGELHRYVLVPAITETEAKQQGKQYFAAHWQKQHTDRVLEVDDCIKVDCIHGRYIELMKADFASQEWENCYIQLN